MEPKLEEETIKKHPQNDCFDCNICLESATDPVVTLCGHLYCWPCIYKWLQQSDEGNYPRHCPVCKVILSLDTLVPLYGRGGDMNSKNYQTLGIPCRPSGQHHRAVEEPRTQQGYDYPHPLIHYRASEFGYSSAVGMAVLPWVMGSRLPASMFDVNPYGGSRRNRNREMERSLQQIWQFLVFFAALCFLLF